MLSLSVGASARYHFSPGELRRAQDLLRRRRNHLHLHAAYQGSMAAFKPAARLQALSGAGMAGFVELTKLKSQYPGLIDLGALKFWEHT